MKSESNELTLHIGVRVPASFEQAMSVAVSQMADEALAAGDVGPRIKRSDYIRRLVEADLRSRNLWPPKAAEVAA